MKIDWLKRWHVSKTDKILADVFMDYLKQLFNINSSYQINVIVVYMLFIS